MINKIIHLNQINKVEPFLIRLFNFLCLSIISFELTKPVIENYLHIHDKKVKGFLYKICASIFILSFTINVGDLIHNFGNIYFWSMCALNWSGVFYCFHYLIVEKHDYELE